MSFLLNILEEGEVFLDIGSNIGSYSILLSKLKKAKSIAFGPIPETYNNLCINIHANNLSSLVFPKMIDLTSAEKLIRKKELFFSCSEGCKNRFVDESYTGKKIKINSSKLDAEVGDLDFKCIKIDVEGSELDVLKGGAEILKKESLISVVIEDQSEEVNNTFLHNGFQSYDYSPITKQIFPLKKEVPNRIWIKKSKLDIIKKKLSRPKQFKTNNVKF